MVTHQGALLLLSGPPIEQAFALHVVLHSLCHVGFPNLSTWRCREQTHKCPGLPIKTCPIGLMGLVQVTSATTVSETIHRNLGVFKGIMPLSAT